MKFDASNIEIRRLDERDVDSVLGIAEILTAAPHWSREHYDEVLRADSSRRRVALVAWDDGGWGVVGFAIAALIPPEAELETIAVAEFAQRRSLGRLLLNTLVTELRTRGIEELLLEVRASNLAAIRFYEATSFKQTGVRIRYYADPEEDAVLMSLRLV